MALFWSRRSRKANVEKEKRVTDITQKLIRERITVHSTELLKGHPDLDYLIFGHYHYPLDLALTEKARQVVLGDWITYFTYAVFDGERLELKKFL